MARVTKAILEEQLKRSQSDTEFYRSERARLDMIVKAQDKIIKIYGGMNTLTVANERVCEAIAHVLGDLKRK